MLEDKTYREWTKEFNPNGSLYEGDWEKGSKIKFIGPDENGAEGGMLSEVYENIPNEYVSIKHIGMIVNGVEDTTSEMVTSWVPAFENYTFKDGENNTTDLFVEMDSNEEYTEMFKGLWPKALDKLKEICER